MEDLIIAGVSIAELKKQKQLIQKDAAKVIADAISKGTEAVEKLLVAETQQDVDTLAAEALDQFQTAEVVSGVSGVSFFLPYYEEYGGYESSEILSSRLEETDNELLEYSWSDKSKLSSLVRLLGSMESDSRGWHSSTC